MQKIKVLLVDDSAFVRQMLESVLSKDPQIQVVGMAHDTLDAREKIKTLNPDVVTLDIEMPGMDGLSFLEKIMTLRPMPVIMVSSLTQKGAEATIRALEIGAVDYVPKVTSRNFDVAQFGDELVAKVKIAARANVRQRESWGVFPAAAETHSFRSDMIIAIGASTGGVEALRDVLSQLPSNTPPVIVTQHMPIGFTSSFAKRLDGLCQARVKEAEDQDIIKPGHIYIAPGGIHLELAQDKGHYVCRLHDGAHISGHKPSVDVLFESVANVAGKKAVGVILTGMGQDGAKGLLKMKMAGSYNVGQDEATSIVYGMPRAAYLAGAVDKQLPLNKIAGEILQSCM